MRIGRVMGNLTMSAKLKELKPGKYLLVEVLDAHSLAGLDERAPREKPMPEALVVFDDLGAGFGQLIAISEGAEATQPFRPHKMPIDAYAAAIIDSIQMTVPALGTTTGDVL